MKTISLEFTGYWLESNKASIPAESGLYAVYACTYNCVKKTVSIRELLYIGESTDVNDRISNHERLSEWERLLKSDETLCYSCAETDTSDRLRAEAALIFHHKPPCNREYKYSFPYAETTILVSGRHAIIDDSFTVYRTE